MAVTITVGTNSWINVADANTYFEAKYNASADWSALSETVKQQLLITAYRWINQQAIFSINASATAQRVKDAQCEAAWYIYKNNDGQEKHEALYAQGVREFKVSTFSEKLELPSFPQYITDMLIDYVDSNGNYKLTLTRSYDEE